MTVKENDHVA
ncbi:hypothetical protein GAJ43_18465 [Escherichia coli]|nr:hypothetical protein [Escherichia coli]